MSVRVSHPAEQLFDPSGGRPGSWRSDHLDHVVVNELGQRGPVVHGRSVSPQDPIVGSEVTLAGVVGVLRYDPIEDLVRGRAERNSVRVEVVSTLQQNPAPVASQNDDGLLSPGLL